MKKIIGIAISICLFFTLSAQPARAKERVEAQRVAFITQRLSLTPEEAQQFWPVYNQFTEKLQQIRANAKFDKSDMSMSDADAEKIILAEFDKESKELELRKEYYQKLKKVLPVKKIARLYRSEQDFRAELLQRLKDNKKELKQMRKE
jgi:hypothetical protein